MTRAWSRSCAFATSRARASRPPTRAEPSPTVSSSARIRSIVANASALSGSAARTTSTCTMSSADSPSVASSTPSTSASAATTSSLSETGAMTTAGDELPAAKASARISCPTTASGFSMKRSFCERPTCTNRSPLASAPSATKPAIATVTGRLLTPRPRRPHGLREIASGAPKRGMYGQKRPRPKSTRAAGSTRSAKIIATMIPVAHAMPSARFPASSANTSVARARATVPPLARIAGPAPNTARRMASRLSSCRRSSSR